MGSTIVRCVINDVVVGTHIVKKSRLITIQVIVTFIASHVRLSRNRVGILKFFGISRFV